MRIEQLHLLAFGPFRDLVLDFSAPGLHVVFGPNEAGKSTTLRAIANLLYGIEATTPDAHRHKPSDLRVGGLLSSENGERIFVVRRKSTSKAGPKSLLDAEGNATGDEALVRMLRGTTEKSFRQAFGLHHAALTQGAEALLSGEGDLGESLFDASLGVGGEVQRLRNELEAEASAIYRPQGRTLPLNDALKAFDEAKKGIKEAQVLPETHLACQRALDEAEAELAKALDARTEGVARRRTLERLRRRVPLERKRQALRDEIQTLGPIVQKVAVVRALSKQVTSYERAVSDHAAKVTELEALRVRQADAVRRAPFDVSVRSREGFRFDGSLETRLRQGMTERATLVQKMTSERSELSNDEREVARLGVALAPARAGLVDTSALARRFGRASALGDVEERLAKDARKVRRKHEELTAGMAAMAPFEGTLEDLAKPIFPSKIDVEALEEHAASLDRAMALKSERLEDLRSQARAAELRMAEQSGDFAPPTRSELEEARSARDEAWVRLRSSIDAERATREMDFERAMRRADDLADRMLREAERVTALATLRSSVEVLERQTSTVHEELVQLQVERGLCDERHAALWNAARMTPRRFSEMRAWLDRRAKLLDQRSEIHATESELRELEETIAATREDLRSELAAIGGTLPSTDRLSDLLAEVESFLERRKNERDEVQKWESDVARRTRSIETRKAKLAEDEGLLAVVNERLAALLGPLGIPGDATSDEAENALSAHRELGEIEGSMVHVSARIAALSDEIRSFEDRVRRLVSELAPDLEDTFVASPLSAANELSARAERVDPLGYELSATETSIEELGDEDVKAEDEVMAADPDAMTRALERLDADLEELETSIDGIKKRRVLLANDLQAMRTRTGAEDAAERAQEALARVRSYVERYGRAKLASILLDREIARYREENQGPVLALTSRTFARLTRDAFIGVRAGIDDRDEAALLCIRANGTQVPVSGLSEGTRDQLYLALRLATLLRHAEINGPMPFVLDDLFVHFDDDRARAGLSVLADVSCNMQVLFFTHHAHLVALAREAVPAGMLHVHTLGASTTDPLRSSNVP